MSAITMIITETEAPSMVTYTLAPTDIAYGVDRCRGRFFRDEDYDIRWSPPVGRESQCGGRVDEDSLCSRCLHNKARWRESCGTAEIRGGNQDWWGRVDDPMPARAPTLAGKNWVAEKKPVWQPAPAPAAVGGAGAPVPAETVESLTATLAALTVEWGQITHDYNCLAEDENEWPHESESEDLYELFRKEKSELQQLNKAIKEGGVLPPVPAATAPPVLPEPETVESLRVKVADMRMRRDSLKQHLDSLLAEGWMISKAVHKAFADVREKTAVALGHLALRAENAALKVRIGSLEEAAHKVNAAALQVGTGAKAEIAAWKARAAALEEQLADADSLNKSLAEQLAGEIQRANEIGDAARSAFEERMVGVREEAVRACREAADFKAQFEEADFHRRAFEEANERLMELNGRLRAELEEAFAAKRQFREDLGAALERATDAEESADLVLTSNAALQHKCDEQEETIDELRRVLRGALGHCADAGELEFLRKERVTQKKERDEAKAALDEMAVQHGEMTREIERLRAAAAVADHEADEAHEESADFQRALAHGDDREDELIAERDRWQERFKDLRRLVVETLAEVEPILEREGTMPAGVALRALSVLK